MNRPGFHPCPWQTRSPRGRAVAIVMLGLSLAGCDQLLEVELPSVVDASAIEEPQFAATLVNSAVENFECAFSDYIVAAGSVGDEFTWGDFNTLDYDRRSYRPDGGNYATSPCSTGSTGATGVGVYTPLQQARWMAAHVHDLLDGWSDADVPQRGTKMATVSAYEGYTLVLLGEAMCEVVVQEDGPVSTRQEAWSEAESLFTRAMTEAQAASDPEILNMARVGRARARLNLGRAVDAAADAQLVPEGFVKNAKYAAATTRSTNTVWYLNNSEIRVAVEDDFWHLPTGGVADPRVSLEYTGTTAHDGITPLVKQTKYPSGTAPIPIARWAEAQLIVAEAQLGQEAVDIVNDLRSRAGLPAFASTDDDAIRQAVIAERSRELFLESQHLGDKIRYGLDFTPATGAPYKQGGSYGSMTCFPLPDAERANNPNAR